MAKVIAQKPITREAFETALSGYVSNDNQSCSLAAERDKELEPINNKYDPQFSTIAEEMGKQFDIVHQYCQENRKKLFVEAKSMEELGANIGYREGKDKVVILEGFAEKAIVAKMVKSKIWKEFVRQTPAMDKAGLIKLKPKGMVKMGFVVKKEETFFLEPIKTEAAEV